MRDVGDLGDWIRSLNISRDPDTYELENEALARDGRLDRKLYELPHGMAAGSSISDVAQVFGSRATPSGLRMLLVWNPTLSCSL